MRKNKEIERFRDSKKSQNALALLIAVLWLLAANTPAGAQESFATEPLTIETADGKSHGFTVELALTGSQQQQGLMFRKVLGLDRGMLFDFGTEREVMMWMRNTLIPLDMLFIDKNGKITRIAANTVPYSEAIISSRGPARYVLELPAGTTAHLTITPNDTVRSRQIGN